MVLPFKLMINVLGMTLTESIQFTTLCISAQAHFGQAFEKKPR
jgi:hypothetical protein